MPKFYTSDISPNNQSKEIGEQQFSVYGSRGGQNSPLMNIPFCTLLLTFIHLTLCLIEMPFNTFVECTQIRHKSCLIRVYSVFGLVCCFTSQSTAMVMLGQSVHLTTLFSWAGLMNKRLTSTSSTYFHL